MPLKPCKCAALWQTKLRSQTRDLVFIDLLIDKSVVPVIKPNECERCAEIVDAKLQNASYLLNTS